jgi:DNA (cytosine-5)-methyltransferase 1
MIAPQLDLGIHDEILVDNFAGGGGASTGIELALGRPVDLAVNHDREAVAMHQANHPRTVHYCESVWTVDPVAATGGRPVGLAWFSPDCKHFSKAKGGKPRNKKIRGLAWVAVRWAALVRPRVIMLENVEEFLDWGPLLKCGSPCPRRRGRTFAAFKRRLVALGYAVEHRELRACDYGAPTIRKRLFLIARCDGRPIVWPEATHAAPASEAVKKRRLKAWRTAAECIDWSLPCPSIFERSRPLAEATCRRIAKGIMRYVVEAAEPFIVRCAHGETNKDGSARRGRGAHPMGEPLPTVTASKDFALVAPVFTEHANASSPRCMPADGPLRTICAQTKGGHHALVSAFLAKHYGGVVGAPIQGPVHTVTATDHHGLVTAHLAKLRGDNVGHAADEPMHTVTGGGTHFAEVRAFLVKYYGTKADGVPISEPMHTVTARERFGLVTVAGEEYEIADIGLRMLAPRELFRAQGFPESYVIDWGYFANENTGRIERRPLTKTAQVRMCGNSVCPPLAAALVAANVPELAVRDRAKSRGRRASV